MKNNQLSKNKFFLSSLILSGILFSSGCKKHHEGLSKPPEAIVVSDTTKNTFSIKDAHEILEEPSLIKDQSNQRVAGDATYIHFGDKQSCTWNPNICNNSFVVWPGYIQNTGNDDWGYAWMSKGPYTSSIPHGTSDHYHIGGLFDPSTEPNPKATSMFGDDWFMFYMQRSGQGKINFDLTQINVVGVPITLWFKAADGKWWYWSKINPGRRNLTQALNIQEIHIRAASALPNDKWSIDDIKVKAR